jgi:hypothetical protein
VGVADLEVGPAAAAPQRAADQVRQPVVLAEQAAPLRADAPELPVLVEQVAVVLAGEVVEVGGAHVERHRHRPGAVVELVLEAEEGLGEAGVVLHVPPPALQPVEPEHRVAERGVAAEADLAAGVDVPEDVPALADPGVAARVPRGVRRLPAIAEIGVPLALGRHPGAAGLGDRGGERRDGETHDATTTTLRIDIRQDLQVL